jgi:ABC-type sugar transport system permease subunit/ABC-type glycerol-3-phosphate transport system substrate-binding protein
MSHAPNRLIDLMEAPALRGALAGTVMLTALWFLSPSRSRSGAKADGVVEIHYMAPSGPLKDAMEDAVREFEHLSRERHKATNGAYPIYKVVAGQHASQNQVEDPTRFILSLVGGEPPDVIYFDRFALSEWASRGTFRPLGDLVEKDAAAWKAWRAAGGAGDATPWPGALPEAPRAPGANPLAAVDPILPEEFFEGAWGEAHYTDPHSGVSTLYGIPCSADNRVLLYNKDLLVKHGFVDERGEAKPPRTWEELEEMAVAMTETDANGNFRSVGFIPNFGNSFLYMYSWLNGGALMSAEGKTCTLAAPENVAALEYMSRIYERLGGAEKVSAFQTTFRGDALDPFIQGQVAMKIDGVWVMSTLAKYGRDLNIGAAAPPRPAAELAKGGDPVSWLGGWAYAIPATSDKSEHAWELIRYLVSKRATEIRLTSERYQAEAQGQEYLPGQLPNRVLNDWTYEHFIAANANLPAKFKEVMRVYNDMLPHSLFRPNTPVGQNSGTRNSGPPRRRCTGAKVRRSRWRTTSASCNATWMASCIRPKANHPLLELVFHPVWSAGLLRPLGGLCLGRARGKTPAPRRQGSRPRSLARARRHGRWPRLEGSKGSFFRSQWREGWFCASPWLVGFLVFTGGPLLFSIVIAFCRFDILRPAVFTGLDNWVEMLHRDELFWLSLKNTLFMVLGVPLGIVVGLGMALLLTKEVKGTPLWRTFFYLPSIVPMVASSILWIWILNPQSGMLNQVLASVGIDGPNWLQSPKTSKWSLILMGLWGAGGGMIIWIAGIKAISTSYYEAASIDGASSFQQFRNITVPMLTPYIFFNLIMGLIGTFQVFTQSFIMTSGGPVNSTLFFVYHLFNNAFRYLNMGYAAAMAWFLFVIVMILTAAQMNLSKKWVHYEGT